MNKLAFQAGYMEKEALTRNQLIGITVAGLAAGLGYGIHQVKKGYGEEGLVVKKHTPLLNPVSSTVGRFFDKDIKAGDDRQKIFRQEDVPNFNMLLDKLNKKYKNKDISVNIGGQDYLRSVGRAWRNPNNTTTQKMLYPLIGGPIGMTNQALFRGDYYDPTSKSISIYNRNPATLAHEFGHYFDMKNNPNRDKNGLGGAEAAITDEIKASKKAINIVKKLAPTVKKDTINKLRKALETYLIAYGDKDSKFKARKYVPEKVLK